MKIFGICMLVLVLTAPSFGDDKKAKLEADPIVFGMLGQNIGCVIFKEYTNTSTKFWGVGVTQKKVGALEVLETQNYEMQQKKWLEDQNGSGELLRLAVKDRIKFVKIPEKYSPAQLEKARAVCKEPAAAPQPEKPDAQ